MKSLRIFSLVVVAALFVSAGLINAGDDPEIKFGCEVFEAHVRGLVNIPEGPIFASDVAHIIELHLPTEGVTSIEGVQYFKGVRSLRFHYNNTVSDISPLAGLEYLDDLWIGGKNTYTNEDIEVLLTLPRLRQVIFNDIQTLTSLMKLEGHPSLQSLHINNDVPVKSLADVPYLPKLNNFRAAWNYHFNDITGIADKFPNLQEVYFQLNSVKDFTPLLDTNVEIVRLDSSQCSLPGIPELIEDPWVDVVGCE